MLELLSNTSMMEDSDSDTKCVKSQALYSQLPLIHAHWYCPKASGHACDPDWIKPFIIHAHCTMHFCSQRFLGLQGGTGLPGGGGGEG